MEKVELRIELKEGIKRGPIQKALEELAADLTIIVPRPRPSENPNIIYGRTSRETYERLFGAELEYRLRPFPEKKLTLRADYISLGLHEWVETKPAQVPQDLEEDVCKIEVMYEPTQRGYCL